MADQKTVTSKSNQPKFETVVEDAPAVKPRKLSAKTMAEQAAGREAARIHAPADVEE